MTKMKDQGWNGLSRSSKIAACMWPSLVPDEVKAQARTIHYDGKDDPLRAKAGVRTVAPDFSRVPGLRKKPQT